LLGSFVVFTHELPQAVYGDVHVRVQDPAEQTSGNEQTLPQLPQFKESVARFSQTGLGLPGGHGDNPVGQTHELKTQLVPPVQA
jgi:hypothetical protein